MEVVFAASEAARKSKSGKGKLGESQGRKASGLHDHGHTPAGLPLKSALIFQCCVALYLLIQTKGGMMNKHSNRNIPVERWPESLEILRLLANQTAPKPVRDVAKDVCAPEISTRNRLAKLEAQGTVRAVRAIATLAPGKQVTCTHYTITQYGRDCAATNEQQPPPTQRVCASSVFEWATNMGRAVTG